MRNWLLIIALSLVALPMLVAQTPRRGAAARPVIPTADRHQSDKVFLEHADQLHFDQLRDSFVRILTGNVRFRKGDMFMYCDSARLNERTSSFEAFDNVRMEQGDTLFIYSDELYYDGETELCELRARPGGTVRLINRDVSLTTDVFFYDLSEEVGFYETGGLLTDRTNTLRSEQGFYYPDTKDAFFYFNVRLVGPRANDTLRMWTDSLAYNTVTKDAEIMCETLIKSKDGDIRSTSGIYNTETGVADLYKRSVVTTVRGNTLTGDTLYYDRTKGYGEAFGNMVLTDSARQSAVGGNYGYYDELRDSAFVTGRAVAMEYSRGDTLYLHGDTITARTLADSTHVTDVYHRVRFYRSDIQGLCDSLSLVERDSVMYMYYQPLIRTGERQVAGNVIYVHLNDSTADWARLPENGFIAEHIGGDCYNQISGADMTAWMADTTLRRLYVEGSVQLIMFPMENDSTYNKYNYTESSYMDAYFNGNEVERIHLWPETSGRVTPLYLARRSNMFLPKFRWYEQLRPVDAEDIFYYPPEMADFRASNPLGKMRADALTVRATATGRPARTNPNAPPEAAKTELSEETAKSELSEESELSEGSEGSGGSELSEESEISELSEESELSEDSADTEEPAGEEETTNP